jgi:hypothetical protein
MLQNKRCDGFRANPRNPAKNNANTRTEEETCGKLLIPEETPMRRHDAAVRD